MSRAIRSPPGKSGGYSGMAGSSLMNKAMDEEVAFLDLRRQLQGIRTEVDACFKSVLDRGSFILGDEGRAFEKEFAAYHGAQYAVGVANGTDALALALRASRRIVPGQGHEVITTSLTAGFTALAILMAGGIPVFADVESDTLLIDPASVEKLIGPQTRAILPVHLYGSSADLDALRVIADRNGLFLLEDCSQAHGTLWNGHKVGTIGGAATFSFYPTKNLGAYGDGGMVISNDREIIERTQLLHRGGIGPQGRHLEAGINSRLDEIHSAVLRCKLKHLDRWNERRRLLAGRYLVGLKGTRCIPCLSRKTDVISDSLQEGHTFHLFVVRHPERDKLRKALAVAGVQTLIHYPEPLHRQEAFRQYLKSGQTLPVVEKGCTEIISLPLYPELAEHEQDKVIAAIHKMDRQMIRT
jgi:dTDP-4-amino-4,6-dideoxygalactose transaminase